MQILGIIAGWLNWIVIGLIALALFGVWRLGRGRRLLVPSGRGRKAASVFLLVFVLALGGFLFLANGPLAHLVTGVQHMAQGIGTAAPDLAFQRVANDSQGRLHEYRDKVVLVNLWATWCPPCRKEMPDLDRLQAAYADRGLVVLNLSDESSEQIRTYLEKNPMRTVMGRADSLGWYEIGGARPITLVIDRQGVVREYFLGGREYGDFEEMVTRYL